MLTPHEEFLVKSRAKGRNLIGEQPIIDISYIEDLPIVREVYKRGSYIVNCWVVPIVCLSYYLTKDCVAVIYRRGVVSKNSLVGSWLSLQSDYITQEEYKSLRLRCERWLND